MIRGIIFATLAVFSLALVLAGMPDPKLVTVDHSQNGISVVIPNNAVEVAPNVFSLGLAVDPSSGKVVEGLAIVHYKDKKANAKPPWAGGKSNGESTCYGHLSKGAKWKTVENYLVDPTNTEGLSGSFVRNTVSNALQKWEDAAEQNIIGDEVAGVINHSEIGDLNGKNEIIFGDISNSGAIAVTIVWGIWYGPPNGREIVEADQIYDQVDYNWTADALIEPTKMDFDNIVTHEHGHIFGMNDLYTADCSEETMYGYGTEGETKKRDLNSGDIAGINKLY